MRKVVSLVLLFLSSQLLAQNITLGEQLSYQVSYNGFASSYSDWSVADAKFSVMPVNFQGKDAYQFLVEIDSSEYSVAESLFKMRFFYRSLLNIAKTRSMLIEHKNDGKKLKHKLVWFDWQEKVAEQFKNRKKKKVKQPWYVLGETRKWVVKPNEVIPRWLLARYQELEKGVPYFRPSGRGKIPLSESTLDQLSATYLFREKEIKVGQTYRFPICTGKKVSTYELLVAKEEIIQIGQKMWSAYKIEINTKNLHGVFTKSDDSRLTVWLSKEKKIPLIYEADVIYGLFKIVLTNVDKVVIQTDKIVNI
jgi:hypothetical protein